MRLVKYLVQSMPAFLAFIIAPYFFLLGAAYDDERLRLLGLDDAGLSASGSNAIYRGFNIWANTSLVSLIERFFAAEWRRACWLRLAKVASMVKMGRGETLQSARSTIPPQS